MLQLPFAIKSQKLTAILALFIALTNCAQLPQQLTNTTSLPTQWQTRGKLLLQSNHTETGKTKRQTLRFSWHQTGEDYRIKLSGSFGLGTTIIQKKSNAVLMLRGKSVLSTASNAEDLFAQHTGMYLPVSQLRYWIAGQQSHQHSPHQLPKDFQHNDWQITYPSLTQVDGYSLPAKMIARNKKYTVTAIFNRWQLGDTALTVQSNAQASNALSGNTAQ
jgi:outer membrane lipoprotein LolB